MVGESKPWVEVLVVQSGNLGASDGALAEKEYSSSRAPVVDDSENAIITLALQEACD